MCAMRVSHHQAERAPRRKRPSAFVWGDSSKDSQAVWVLPSPPRGAGEPPAADTESSEVTQVGSGWAPLSPAEPKVA